MSLGLEIAEPAPAVVGTSNGNGSTRGDGAAVIKRGIDLLRRPELNKSIAFTETCPTCGGPLTQGECLRCLVSLGFLSDSQQPDKSETRPTIDTWTAEVPITLKWKSARTAFRSSSAPEQWR